MPVATRVATVIAATVLILGLAGCAAPQHPHGSTGKPTASSSASSSASEGTAPPPATSNSTPAPIPAGLATVVTPSPLAAVGCHHLLDSSALGAILVGPKTSGWLSSQDAVFSVVGGITCSYGYGGSDHVGEVDVEVVPSAIAAPTELKASLAPAYCGPLGQAPNGCTVTSVVNGWWYQLSDGNENDIAPKVLTAGFTKMVSMLTTSLNAIAAPQKVDLVHPFDCSAVTTVGTLASRVRESHPDYLSNNEIGAAAFLLGGPSTCSYVVPGGTIWDLTVYPGGATAYSACSAASWVGGAPISVPGVQAAYSWKVGPDDGTSVCATDGTSTIAAGQESGDNSTPLTSVERKSLGALLVTVFAAAVPSSTPWTASAIVSSAPAATPALAGGDCRKLLEMKPAVGTAPVPTSAGVSVGDLEFATVGGIDCDYKFTNAKTGTTSEVQALVAPNAISDPAQRDASLAPPLCGADPNVAGGQICAETATVAGWWYSLRFTTSATSSDGVSQADAVASLAAISGPLAGYLTANAAPTSVGAGGSFTCPTSLGGAAVSSSRTLSAPTYGNDNELRAAAYLLADPVTCSLASPHGDLWDLTVYPGSVSAYLECNYTSVSTAGAAKALTVPGVKSAYSVGNDGQRLGACVSDGTSTVLASIDDPNLASWSKAKLTSLGSYAVPLLAAATSGS